MPNPILRPSHLQRTVYLLRTKAEKYYAGTSGGKPKLVPYAVNAAAFLHESEAIKIRDKFPGEFELVISMR